MSTQVSSLQTELASVKAMLTEERRRPSRYAWALALIILCGSAALVITGIHTGLLGSTIAGESSTFQTEARLDLARSFQALQPVISLEERKGAAWVLDHADKADLRDTNASLRWAKAYDAANAAAAAGQGPAEQLELAGRPRSGAN